MPPICDYLGCVDLGYFVDSLKYVDPSAVAPGGRIAVLYYPDIWTGFGRGINGCFSTLTNLALNPAYVPSFQSLTCPNWIAHLWIAGLDGAACPAPDGWYPPGVSQTVAGLGAATSILDVLDFDSGNFLEQTPYAFAPAPCAEPALAGPPPDSVFSKIRYEPFDTAASWSGNLTQLVTGADPDDQENTVVLMSEWGDASFFKDIAWPTNALELSFDYMFREPRGSESLTVYLDGQAIYYDGAQTTLATEHLTSSGALYVGTAGGMTRRLNFVLRTDGTLGGGVALDNIRVFGLVLGDVDLDGDVDLFDSGELQRCFGLQPVDNDCLAFDLDQTGDVGLSDFAIMEPNLTGPTTPGIP